MEGKDNKCDQYLKTLQKVLVSLLVLSIVCLVITMRTLSIFAEQNTALTGSGRTLITKNKADSQITLITL